MADHTINIDVFDLTVPELNPINIAIINLPNPVIGYSANAEEVKALIQIPRYTVFESGTSNVINGKNYYDYFPEEGGGGGGVTPEEVQSMITASIDPAVSSSSTNAIQNKVIKEYVDTGLSSKADTSSLADVATSGDYGDLVNPPTVDSSISTTSTNAVQNATITNFVNSSIETATAEFKGTFETKEAMNAVTGNKNDYAFLIVKNADGTVNHYERYKWVETPVDSSHWVLEYNLNNSSYTAEQWAAINSGIKSTDVAQIGTNTTDISNLRNEKVDKIDGKGLSTNDFTDADKDQISTNETDISSHVGNKNNPHNVTKSQIGLGNVDNTSDLSKPISTATQTALDTKIDTAGTGLSKSGTTLNHSNSVTAKSTQAFVKVAYDANGHITGTTEATQSQNDAINSGINATKVAQIETNENNISLLETKANTNASILSQTYNSADCNFTVYLVPDNGSGSENTTHYNANDSKASFVIRWKKNQYKYYEDNVEHYKYRIDSLGVISTNNASKKDELTLYSPPVTNETYVKIDSDPVEQGKTTGTFQWRKGSSNVGDIWYIRPHIEYTDLETGMEYTMYGAVYKVTVGTPCTIECDTLSCTELTQIVGDINSVLEEVL